MVCGCAQPSTRFSASDVRGNPFPKPIDSVILTPRKGIPCHKEIIKGFLKNMTFEEKDKVIWSDLVPNRCLGYFSLVDCSGWPLCLCLLVVR